jgi:hypothetical protein
VGSELKGSDLYIRSEAVVARIVAGETLVVPIRSSVGDLASIYSFNGTGTFIWKLLETPRAVAALASCVAEEYEVDLMQAEADVAQFLSELQGLGLIDVSTSLAMAGD